MQAGRPPDRTILLRIVRLSGMVTGVATGLVLGLGIFIATNWLVLKGGERVGPHLALLAQFFIGYSVTFTGSLIGLGYGFVCGFLLGFFVALVHNWIAELRHPLSKTRG